MILERTYNFCKFDRTALPGDSIKLPEDYFQLEESCKPSKFCNPKVVLIKSEYFNGNELIINDSKSCYGMLAEIIYFDCYVLVRCINVVKIAKVDNESKIVEIKKNYRKTKDLNVTKSYLRRLVNLMVRCKQEQSEVTNERANVIVGNTFFYFLEEDAFDFKDITNAGNTLLELMSDINISKRFKLELVYEEDINEAIMLLIQKLKDMEAMRILPYLKEKERNVQKPPVNKYTLDYSNKKEVLEYVKNENLPEYIKNKVHNVYKADMKRSSEYLHALLTLPFCSAKKTVHTPSEIKKILDSKHYGMNDVKEKISDYISMLNLNIKNVNPPILCLVGEAGTGKTTIAYAIAEALNRDFVKMSVGGLEDSSSIKGFEATYTGATPGMVIRAMQQSESINPVFLIDEIDKMSSIHGDPVGALLEVLDPTQNKTFLDTYLSVPYDLSKVLFITTANSIDDIPIPLKSRLEVIEIPSYTLEEKVIIAKDFAIKKYKSMYELDDIDIQLSDEDIRYIIFSYTNEAGVRELERCINQIMTKVAIKYKNTDKKEIEISKEIIEQWLGKPKYKKLSQIKEKSLIGVCNSILYSNNAHGQIIEPIEVLPLNNKSGFKVDSIGYQLEVPFISTALRYLEVNSDCFNLSSVMKNKGYHIHMQGFHNIISDNGVSCSVLLATISALTNIPINNTTATIGEVSLRGQLIKTIDMKNKLSVAAENGIKKLYVPSDGFPVAKYNKKIMYGDMEVIPVENAKELIELIFENKLFVVFGQSEDTILLS